MDINGLPAREIRQAKALELLLLVKLGHLLERRLNLVVGIGRVQVEQVHTLSLERLEGRLELLAEPRGREVLLRRKRVRFGRDLERLGIGAENVAEDFFRLATLVHNGSVELWVVSRNRRIATIFEAFKEVAG